MTGHPAACSVLGSRIAGVSIKKAAHAFAPGFLDVNSLPCVKAPANSKDLSRPVSARD